MRLSICLFLLLLQPALVLHSQPKHLKIAETFIGTTEATGKNDGPVVEHIIKKMGGAKGSSYCAYFVSFCLDSANVNYPKTRSGMARSFKNKNSIPASEVILGKTTIPQGSIVIWEKGTTVFGHTGFVWVWGKKYGATIEGNTSPGNSGSQADGGGIFYRKRKIEPANYFRITAFTLVTY